MTAKLTHIDQTGAAHMVDVGDKAETDRVATAEGAVKMKPETLALILKAMPRRAMLLAQHGSLALWRRKRPLILFRSVIR